MEHNGTCRMKMNESYNLTTNGIVGTSCRLQTFRTNLLGLFDHARAVHLWILVARKWQQDATCFWRFAAIFMLFPPRLLGFKDVEGKTWKSWGSTNIPKPSTSESFHQHPPTSTNPTKQPQCHEYPQVAHSLTQSPWVPSACRCRSPLPPDENEECAEPLTWYSSGMLRREVHNT